MMLGVTGAGKSTLGNFICGKAAVFPESDVIMESKTKFASIESTKFGNNQLLEVIDSPGLNDTQSLGKSGSKAIDTAEDHASLITELTKMMIMIRAGITAFLIVIPVNVRDHSGTQSLLDFLDIFGNYWNHSIVVLTHGKTLARTEKEQYKKFNGVLDSAICPPIWKKLRDKVNNRFVIVESKEWRLEQKYQKGVVNKLIMLTSNISRQHGIYDDGLNSIGNDAYARARLELRHEFHDLDSPEAQEAIYKRVFHRVKEVMTKLVRIKLAGGVDVDKLKEMAELKRKEADSLREAADLLRQEYEDEQKKRLAAEKEAQKEEERRRQAERDKLVEKNKRERAENEAEIAKKEKARAEYDKTKAEREKTQAEKEKAKAEREKTQAEYEKAIAEREKTQAEKEKTKAEREKTQAEYEKAIAEREKTQIEREKNKAERDKDKAEAEKALAKQDRDWMEMEKKRIENEKKEAEREKHMAQDIAEQQRRLTEDVRSQSQQQLQRYQYDLMVTEQGRQAAEKDAEEAQKRLEASNNRGFFRRMFNLKPSST